MYMYKILLCMYSHALTDNAQTRSYTVIYIHTLMLINLQTHKYK